MYSRMLLLGLILFRVRASEAGPIQDGFIRDSSAIQAAGGSDYTIANSGASEPGIHQRSNQVSRIKSHQLNNTVIPVHRDCPFSPWDEFYITDFLQEQLDGLSTSDHCWIIKGVHGLKELLHRNISANPLNNVTIPLCVPINVTSSGNTFSIDFSDSTYEVNGVHEDTFVVLTYVHRK